MGGNAGSLARNVTDTETRYDNAATSSSSAARPPSAVQDARKDALVVSTVERCCKTANTMDCRFTTLTYLPSLVVLTCSTTW